VRSPTRRIFIAFSKIVSDAPPAIGALINTDDQMGWREHSFGNKRTFPRALRTVAKSATRSSGWTEANGNDAWIQQLAGPNMNSQTEGQCDWLLKER
jgi:hypothetical protein